VARIEAEASVEVRTRIAASPETVFEFFTDPDKMIQWMGRSAELDARPGGAFRCDINGRHIASGEYVEIEPPHRVVFSWGWEGEDAMVVPGASRVEVRLTRDGDATDVFLIHSELPSDEAAERHRHGWEHYAERLALAASGANAGPDPWASANGSSATSATP
jgi:uncharacterized protein YndB with AHSA1/START domain